MIKVLGLRVVRAGILLGGLSLGAACSPRGRAVGAQPASVPSKETKEGRDEQRKLVASRSVAVFEVVGPGHRAFDDYRAALLLGRELARRFGGFPWDEE